MNNNIGKLKSSEEEFQRIAANAKRSPKSEMETVARDFNSQIDIGDLSAREIEDIAEKAAKKESLTELNRARVSPSLSLEAKILVMSRLGIPVNRIAARLKVTRLTALKYSENPRLVRSIRSSMKRCGWEITHIVNCPLSTQRFLSNMVSRRYIHPQSIISVVVWWSIVLL